MVKTQTTPHQLVDRLEKKYQKKLRIQKYKSVTQNLRQTLSRVSGQRTDDFDDMAQEIENFGGYEYLAR
jgi:hypothetical protein